MPIGGTGYQRELEYTVEQPDWVALKILLSELDEEMSRRRVHLLRRISLWLAAIQIFRRFEDDKMLVPDPSSRDKEYHRASLTSLLGFGETLLIELQASNSVDPTWIGIQVSDLSSSVETLRMNFFEWFSDMTPSRKAETEGDAWPILLIS